MFFQSVRRFVRPLLAVISFSLSMTALLSITGVQALPERPGGITLVKVTGRSFSQSALRAVEKTATRGSVSSDKKTLTFNGKRITLVVHTGPEDDMLSYRIAGLKNPALLVPQGATLNIVFINEDSDMKHDLRFTNKKAPFPAEPDRKESTGSPALAPHTKTVRFAEQMVVRAARTGTYVYLCTVKGHAAGGMFGTIIVR